MTSSNQSFYIINEDEESSEQLFYFLNRHFSLFINNFEYISDTDANDDDYYDLPDLIDNTIESFHDEHIYKNVVTEEVYENLKKQNIKFKELCEVEKNENMECPISLEKFNDEDNIIKLNCGHFFHKEPILFWLYMQKHKCPICRYEYPFIEKRIEYN
jgi:hypothetical protein